jgi:hypothetical protein
MVRKLLALLLGCSALISACADRGNPWAAINQLPDWSGAWVKDGAQSTIFEDCCVPGRGTAPLQPKYRALRDAAAEIVAKGLPGGDNLAKCYPDGVPGILLHGVAFEFLHAPGRVTMITENGEVRRIYTDGRPHPPRDELYQSVEGHSIGRWDGDTLVVDTIGMDTRAMLFLVGNLQVTRQTQVVERMQLTDQDTLQIATTVTDPELFTAPYSYTLSYQRGLREEDFNVGCMQSNRDNGETTDLTPPPEE